MRILVIIPSYKPAFVYGGPIRSVGATCEALVRIGHDVTVYTTNANGATNLKVETGKVLLVDGVKVIYFNRWTKDHSNLTPSLLLKLFRNALSFDAVHIHSWWNAVTIPSALICRLQGIKPIISPRGSITSYTFGYRNSLFKKAIHQLGGKALLSKCSFHVTSNEEEDELKDLIGKNISIYLLPNILELPTSICGQHTPSTIFRLVYLSRIDPKKNIELLFRVLRKLKDLPISLTLLGDGEKEYVSSLKRESSDIPQIFWKGNVDGEEKFKILAESDLFVLPSYTENYANVVFESLCQGTPVLISNNVGARDYVKNKNLGWVIERDDDVWSQTLREIWLSKDVRDEIRQRAPICIAEDFNAFDQAKKYSKMYAMAKNNQ